MTSGPACEGRRTVYVVTRESVREAMAQDLATYQADLARAGYRCVVRAIGEGETPPRLRALLRAGYETDGLCGAVLIGAIPSLLFNKDGEGKKRPEYWHDHPCDGYYMDLYGEFSEPNSRGALTRWEPDTARDGGAQIWVSRLRADTLADAGLGSEVEMYRRYFARNHAYRAGTLELPPPRACTLWHTIDIFRSAWGTCADQLYGEGCLDRFGGQFHMDEAAQPYGEQYRGILRDPRGYEFMALNTVTLAAYHDFGGLRLDWRAVRDIGPKRILFYHMLTSEPGRHDAPNYLGGVYLFSESLALAMFAGTQHSGGPGKELYPALLRGGTVGEAWQEAIRHVVAHDGEPGLNYVGWKSEPENWPCRPEHHAAGVLLGDGTLRLPPGAPGAGHGSKQQGSMR